MITTVGDLVTYARQELNSEKIGGSDTNSLWKDAELIDYVDQAQQEFSRKTECLRDDSNYNISVVSGTKTYALDTGIINVYAGYLTDLKRRVIAVSFEDMEKRWILNSDSIEVGGDWEDDTGPPKFIIMDLAYNTARLYPIPIADDTLDLYVSKEATHITSLNDNLEIPSQYRLGLTYKIKSLAYAKHDVLETEDMQRSMLNGQKWESFVQDAQVAYGKRFKA